MRNKIYFYCSGCNKQNYYSTKNKTSTADKLLVKKFCNNCRKVVGHKERNK